MKETTVRSENDGSTVVFFVRYAAKCISCLYEDAFERWATWMKENKISWTYWAYANKDEASSMLKAGAVPDFAAEDYAGLDSYLSPSGVLIKRMLAL